MSVPDKMLVCPYNKAHFIFRQRMPAHLIKCGKKYKGEVLMMCPFNAMHLFTKKSKEDHYKECEEYVLSLQKQSMQSYYQ
ncbi:CLUMA_CG011504, isoform A [Clunio marinus]|uniref:CLUMA_CG011504, isoform A n=1 Tax=Clunio marinus TaxID=568069 RepID=A0A1J1ID20_9DIPT|nr:CLUMA_CG011504, isoform A [Clunio marinus]